MGEFGPREEVKAKYRGRRVKSSRRGVSEERGEEEERSEGERELGECIPVG